MIIQEKRGIPQYLRVAEHIIRKIESGEFAEGSKIPSEMELSRKFNVSRHVVRRAIGRVEGMGRIITHQGKGSYVKLKPQVISYAVSEKTCFRDNMELLEKRHRSVLLKWKKGDPTEKEAHALQIELDEQVYRLEILRYIEEAPFSITTSVLLQRAVPLMEQYLDDFRSLYGLLKNHYQFIPVRVWSVFEATAARLKEADYLEMPPDMPILKIESLMYHPAEYPVEYGVTRVRGDAVQCYVEFEAMRFANKEAVEIVKSILRMSQ